MKIKQRIYIEKDLKSQKPFSVVRELSDSTGFVSRAVWFKFRQERTAKKYLRTMLQA